MPDATPKSRSRWRAALIQGAVSVAAIHAVVLVAFLVRGSGGSRVFGEWLIYGAIASACISGLFTMGGGRRSPHDAYAQHVSLTDADRLDALGRRESLQSFGLILFAAAAISGISGYILSGL